MSAQERSPRRSFGMPGRYWGDEVDEGLASRPELRSRERARTTAVAAAAFAWTEAAWSGVSGRLSGDGASPVPPMSGGRRPKARVRAPRRHEPAVAVARASAHPARAGSRPPGRLCSTRCRAGSTNGNRYRGRRQNRCGCGQPNPRTTARGRKRDRCDGLTQPTRRRVAPARGSAHPPAGGEQGPPLPSGAEASSRRYQSGTAAATGRTATGPNKAGTTGTAEPRDRSDGLNSTHPPAGN